MTGCSEALLRRSGLEGSTDTQRLKKGVFWQLHWISGPYYRRHKRNGFEIDAISPSECLTEEQYSIFSP